MKQDINGKLKIAVPNKGRLLEPALDLLRAIGLEFEKSERQFSVNVTNFDLEVVFISASAIPEYVQNRVVDLGITGLDLVREDDAKVEVLERLRFGRANLVLAAPADGDIQSVKDLNGKKITTSFPFLAGQFLEKNKIKAEIIEVDGAVEITPQLGLADAIVDLSSSGCTLKANKLRPLAAILESEAVLIGNGKSVKGNEKIKELLLRLESVLTARQKRYIMMNAPKELLSKIKKVAPGLSAPTVMKLSKRGMMAIHSVVETDDVWRIINELKEIGASGILVVPIEKMIK